MWKIPSWVSLINIKVTFAKSKKMVLSIIVAVSSNNVIGNKNQLIWHITEDLKHFKKTTLGAPVIMGRKTYESIGKALPGRKNIVITKKYNYKAEGCVLACSLEDAIRLAKESNPEEVFIIGGSSIYQQAMDLADKLYVTKIEKEYEGDSFFPEIDLNRWDEIKKETLERGVNFEYPFSFINYQRRK